MGDGCLRVQGKGTEPIEKGAESDPGLHAGEMHAEAHMDAEPEPEVLASLTEHVEAIRVDIVALVPIGRSQQECHVRSGIDRHARQFCRSCGPAQDHRHRRLPPQRLLEGLRVEGAVSEERVELGAIAQERQEKVAGGAIRGLDPRR